MNIILKNFDRDGYSYIEYNTALNIYQKGHSAMHVGHYNKRTLNVVVVNKYALNDFERQILNIGAQLVTKG